jgi:hypothetical protein
VFNDAAYQWLKENDPASAFDSAGSMPENIADWNLHDLTALDWQEPRLRLVYFVQAGPDGPVKIGTSMVCAYEKRLSTLRSNNHEELLPLRHVRGDHRLEAKLHRYFVSMRLHREWFRMEGDLAIVAKAGPPRN